MNYSIKKIEHSIAYQQSSLKNNDPNLSSFYGLDKNVKFCKRCLISNQRPSSSVEFKNKGQAKSTIEFDKNGICSACNFQDLKDNSIDWIDREKQLMDLCNKFRKKNSRYDCIVPASGGKDSFYTAHLLKSKYGMSPLTVTWAPHIYTDSGKSNMDRMIHAGFDNLLFTPNGALHRTLTRLGFLNLCHPFQSFIIGQRLIGPKIAKLYDVKLIFYGENQAEYGNNIKDNDNPKMQEKFISNDKDDKIIIGKLPLEKIIKDNGFHIKSAEPYTPISHEELISSGIEVHYLSYYKKWDPQENYYYAVDNSGFMPNDQRTEGTFSRYSSFDDKIDPLHYYTTLIKFGIGRATYDAAYEIRTKKIDIDEGKLLIKKYEHEFPNRYFNEILEYMKIDAEKFIEVIDSSRSPHLWKYSNGEWDLRHKSYL